MNPRVGFVSLDFVLMRFRPRAVVGILNLGPMNYIPVLYL